MVHKRKISIGTESLDTEEKNNKGSVSFINEVAKQEEKDKNEAVVVAAVQEFPLVVERTEIVRVRVGEPDNTNSQTELKSFLNAVSNETQSETATASAPRKIATALDEAGGSCQDTIKTKCYNNNNQRKSARFSLFNWFKKGNDFDKKEEEEDQEETDKEEEEDDNDNQHRSKRIIKNDKTTLNRFRKSKIYSSSVSVDTTCSTATVHSFTFRSGDDINEKKSPNNPKRFQYFRKHLSADNFEAEEEDIGKPETRRSCIPQLFESDPSLLIKRKNSIFNDDKNVKKTEHVEFVDEEKTVINKNDQLYNIYRSLPTAGKSADLSLKNSKKRYVHVKGKGPAPKPPRNIIVNNNNQTIEKNNNNNNNNNTAARRKRRAPEPPGNKIVPVIINDTLKLEGGILLPRINKDIIKNIDDKSEVKMNQVFNSKMQENNGMKKSQSTTTATTTTTGGVLPRPWYKRSNTTLSERDICGSFRREVLKIPTLSSRASKTDKGGTSRFSFHHDNNNQDAKNFGTRTTASNSSSEMMMNSFDKSFSKLNHIFGRSNINDHCNKMMTKKDTDKRKSNLNILTNISELDREAAAIVQEEQARNQAISRSNYPRDVNHFEKTPSGDIISEMVSASIEPQRRGTRALISKFNAISNITKSTVNSTFFNNKSPSPSSSTSSSSSGILSSPKIDVIRNGNNSIDKKRSKNVLVTKRLICDGTERVNETGADVTSINFFRRLEDEASKISDNHSNNSASASAGWEEKIKRYFPERVNSSALTGAGVLKRRETSNELNDKKSDKNYLQKQRDKDFNIRDNNPRSVDKIEQLSRADLKEMLIEMKHSLPKRPKNKLSSSSSSSAKLMISNNNNNEKASNPMRKSIQPVGLIGDKLSSQNNKATTSNDVEMRNKNIVRLERREEEERKKPRSTSSMIIIDNNNKVKVSSAAQTSANLRKIESQILRERLEERGVDGGGGGSPNSRKSTTGIISEDTIYTLGGKRKEGASLKRNTFQLIRPRDFACIEAMKTEKASSSLSAIQNTYMNVIEDSIYANAIINTNPTINNSDDKSQKLINIQNHDKRKDLSFPKLEIQKPDGISRGDGDEEARKREKESASSVTNMNTMAINRLLRKLEGAIASGQHQQAAGLAKELAQLKIHCSVVRQRYENNKTSDFINVDMYIEDKLAHQGPIPLQLSLNMTVAQLKDKVFAEFEIPTNVQRWIIGKNLADNDDFTINDLKAVDKSSIFLYLVAPDLQNDESIRVHKTVAKDEETIEAPPDQEPPKIEPILEEEVEAVPQEPEEPAGPVEPSVEELKIKRYEHLMSLENSDVIPNSVPIECPICFAPYGPLEGVILRDCLHMFCRTCIANTIMYCEEAEVKCPFRDSEYTCESTLQEREIKALVTPEIYEQHLAKSVSQAENNAGNNAFHCKTPDCRGWCIYDDNVNVFLCPVCGVNNCLTCQAIHTNKNCREYQDEIKVLKETDQETKRTAAVLEEMVESGEALACPTCAVVLMKKWGCDWLRCSMCKTEICWVTRGPRWGPAGKGDTSGGCKCGENGVKCHPRCNYCH